MLVLPDVIAGNAQSAGWPQLTSVVRPTTSTDVELALLSTLEAAAPVGLGFIDRRLCLARVNPALAAWARRPVDELVGNPVAEVLPTMWETLEPVYRHVVESGEAVPDVVLPGEVVASLCPVRIGNEIVGTAVVVVDGTAFLHTEGAPFRARGSRSPRVAIRVVIADGDTTATRSFQAVLDHHDGIDVVAAVTTSAEAVECAGRVRPDVMLVNHALPDGGGLPTASLVRAASPSTSVIVMTDTWNHAQAAACADAGCAGVLDKSRAWVDLVSAVRAAYHGETTISHAELLRVLAGVQGQTGVTRTAELTSREQDVLECLREGLSNPAIAKRLGVTSNTVRNHVQRILHKLDVHSKLEALVVTSSDGLPGPPA